MYIMHSLQYVIDCDKIDTAPIVDVTIAEYKFTLTGSDYIFKVSRLHLNHQRHFFVNNLSTV